MGKFSLLTVVMHCHKKSSPTEEVSGRAAPSSHSPNSGILPTTKTCTLHAPPQKNTKFLNNQQMLVACTGGEQKEYFYTHVFTLQNPSNGEDIPS
jgi:hypothetical protein